MWQNANGAFVISWSQVELDGSVHSTPQQLREGCSLRWRGDYMRLDGPSGVLPLGDPIGFGDVRERAARKVQHHLDRAAQAGSEGGEDDPLLDHGFTVTDGTHEWRVALIDAGDGAGPLCLFDRHPPVSGKPLWVVRTDCDTGPRYVRAGMPRGVICFTPGTMIQTGDGAIPVELLTEGDMIQTKDNGLQPVVWMGMRSLSGARLRVSPELAPIRLRAGALNDEIPDEELVVSPDHRIVLRGPRARALFSSDEVLVAARDLVNDRSITVDRGHAQVTYIHLALPQHEVIFANKVETESFHPLSAGLDSLDDDDRARLLGELPDLAQGEWHYGDYARRMLTRAETVIMRGDAGL